MANPADTTKTAEFNDPARPKPGAGMPRGPQTGASASEAPKAQDKAHDESVADLARKATAERASAAQDAAADHASEQAERVREAGESFDPDSFAHAASERLADNLSEAARSIRGTDLSHLTDDLAAFARRQPLLFFGGAALLGFAAGRAMKASERAEHDDLAVPSYERRGA